MKFFNESSREGVYYRGLGLKQSPYENTQQFAILRGNPTTYSAKNDQEEQRIISQSHQIVLVGASQGLHGERLVVSGSVEIFSNEFLGKQGANNLLFMKNVVGWFAQLLGRIRFYNATHRLQKGSEELSEYKTTDDIHFEVVIEELDAETNSWLPYVATDIGIELYLMDPYIRTTLKQQSKDSPLYVLDTKVAFLMDCSKRMNTDS